jgi:hypothetical protein
VLVSSIEEDYVIVLSSVRARWNMAWFGVSMLIIVL